MPYLKKWIVFEDSVEVEKVFSGRYGKRTKHSKKVKPTSEEMIKINRRQAAKRLRWKIKANFKTTEDYHLVLTYNHLIIISVILPILLLQFPTHKVLK